MKTEVTLLNGVRFAPDAHTRLHVHTAQVSPDNEQLVVPEFGPKMHLRQAYWDFPKISIATPYGSSRDTFTSFQFSWDNANIRNFATTAPSNDPILPEELSPREYGETTLGLTSRFRLSVFIPPRHGGASSGSVARSLFHPNTA